jgi:hypothetical protein
VDGESRAIRGGWPTVVLGFNISVSAREGRWDKVSPEDEVETENSSWLHRKEA